VTSKTSITGISVGYNIDGDVALTLLRQVGGTGINVSDEKIYVSDEKIYEAQQMLLEREGIFSEPAGAAALAGLIAAREAGEVDPDRRVVCVVTGSGSKDPGSISRAAARQPAEWIEPDDLEELLSSLTLSTGSGSQVGAERLLS
jgi:threonine synthase